MKKLLILSGKGGTGKTTTAAAFIDFLSARAFADCDVDAPNLHLVAKAPGKAEISDYLGSQKAFIDPEKCLGCGLCLERCRFDAIDYKSGKCAVNEYSCEGCGVCQYICPQGAVTMGEDIAGEQRLYTGERCFSTAKLRMGRGNSGKLVAAVKSALFQRAADADFAIIDGSPGIGCPVIASISGVDLVLIVAEPSRSGVSDMERIIKTAGIFQTGVAVCINKADISPDKTRIIRERCAEGSIPFVGSIPYDRQAAAAINAGHSLAHTPCPARDALKAVFDKTMELLEGVSS